ncbi:hypothetical protein LINPERHAP2_LOCUS41236 [Linum perenne]
MVVMVGLVEGGYAVLRDLGASKL